MPFCEIIKNIIFVSIFWGLKLYLIMQWYIFYDFCPCDIANVRGFLSPLCIRNNILFDHESL